MSEKSPKEPLFLIRDFETLKVLADPLRMQLLSLLQQPRTVKELGERLEMPPTKLYYHVNQLLNVALIRVTDTNLVSGIIEKRYAATAEEVRVDPDLLSPQRVTPEYVENLLHVVFDSAKKDIRRSVATGLLNLGTDAGQSRDRVIARMYVELTRSQFEAYQQRLADLLREVQEAAADSAGKKPAERGSYGLTVALYPLPSVSADEADEAGKVAASPEE
jgi:DNA-binding transcriptional ArsR family regulator